MSLRAANATVRDHERVLRRVWWFSGAAWTVAVVVYAVLAEWKSVAGVTCSAAVVMMNFAWLEQIVGGILQPTPRLKAWRLAVRTLARFALFGVALSIAIFIAQFDAVSVLIGVSVLVAGILIEALYSTVVSLKS